MGSYIKKLFYPIRKRKKEELSGERVQNILAAFCRKYKVSPKKLVAIMTANSDKTPGLSKRR